MQIAPGTFVRVADVLEVFPRTDYPAFMYSDFLWEVREANALSFDGATSLPHSQQVGPSVLRVPHNNYSNSSPVPDPNDYPSIAWDVTTGSASLRESFNYPDLHREVASETWDSSSPGEIEATATLPGNCRGFEFKFRRTDYADATALGKKETSYSDAPFTLTFTHGSGSDALQYQIKWNSRGEVVVQKEKPDGSGGLSFKPVMSVPGTADVAKVQHGNYATDGQDHVVEVYWAAGKLYIAIGTQADPILLDEARLSGNGPITSFSSISIESHRHRTFYCSVHPHKYYASASIQNGSQADDSVQRGFSIGFRSLSQPTYKIIMSSGDSVEEGGTVYLEETDTDSLLGPFVSYRLVWAGVTSGTYKGVDYVDTPPPAVHAVLFSWPRGPLLSYTPSITEIQPTRIEVSQAFSPETLQITSSADLTFQNWNGWWGNWSHNSGHVAVTVQLSRTAISTGSMGPLTTVYTGLGHHQGSIQAGSGSSDFTMKCVDRVAQLRTTRFSLPWMDGWNYFYTIAFLAQLGGVSIEDMVFGGSVPDDPFDDSYDPDGPSGMSYFLPVGLYNTVLTRHSSADLWEVISKIAQSIGYQVYFNTYGKLVTHKFRFASDPSLMVSKRWFFEDDATSALMVADGGAEGMMGASYQKDMSSVRNGVIIVGIKAFDPIRDSFAVKVEDLDSMNTSSAFNHLGYKQPFVWADSQFADEAYAYEAAIANASWMRLPTRMIHFTTWMQPDIFPLDCITISSLRLGQFRKKGLVMTVNHSIDQESQFGRTTIGALMVQQ